MKKLTAKNFEYAENSGIVYLTYKSGSFEICLEPCLNGFCVGLYDDNQELLKPKACTNIDLVSMADKTNALGEPLEKAMTLANQLWSKKTKQLNVHTYEENINEELSENEA